MIIHVVKKGDSLWSIARQYNTTADRLMIDNGMNNSSNLVVGQALLVLIPKIVYTVQPGDTLESVSNKFAVTINQLLQNNPNIINAPYLLSGQNLVISFTQNKRREVTVNAYAYPHIKRNILKQVLPYLTYLTIFGYGFKPNGELIPIDDQPIINLAYQFRTAPVMLISSITEDGNFSGSKASMLFNNVDLQNKVINNILKVMKQKGYVGLDVDFEYVEAKDKDAYIKFLENVTKRLNENNYFVNTDLAPKISADQAGILYEAHDYKEIGRVSNTVLLMTYEWGYTYGPPMAVAPINQVSKVVKYAVSEIPSNKILMGIPNYGYDWQLPFEKGVTKAETIGNEYAIELAYRTGAEIQFDQTARTPFYEYYKNGKKHVVWFEDVRSILAKFNLMDENKLLGAGYWNAMRPFAQNYSLLSSLYNIRKVVSE